MPFSLKVIDSFSVEDAFIYIVSYMNTICITFIAIFVSYHHKRTLTLTLHFCQKINFTLLLIFFLD